MFDKILIFYNKVLLVIVSVHNLVAGSVITVFCDNTVRVEKYRPGCLDDLISHKDITSTSK